MFQRPIVRQLMDNNTAAMRELTANETQMVSGGIDDKVWSTTAPDCGGGRASARYWADRPAEYDCTI